MPLPTWEQIEAIFLAAADLPLEAQAEFLEHACHGDCSLREEVESLLDSDRKSSEKITRAVEDEAQSLFGLSPMAGSRLGSWRVVREIGRGGMGAVYLATRDDDQFQKKVAIKLVKRGMDTAEVQRRFQHERQILAGLDHAYIARLIDAGTAPDGRSFFVMEYVEGEPIDAYCRGHSLSFADRCRLLLKVCEAVSHAHRNLVVHRDLKPGNIFVAPDGTPKLLDFGVAKLLAPNADPHFTVTGMQSALLTPQYASPEQVMGRPVNTSTDVYSLGAVLYELLTGSCAQRLDSTSPEEIERVVCVQELPPPSSITPGLPRDLDNIVMMAMRKDQERRYHSIDQFAGDIRRYLDGRPVLARKDSFAYRAGKFIRRNRLMIAAASLVMLSLVGGIVMATYQARRAERRLKEMVDLANRSLFDVHSAIERLPGAMDARREIVKTTLAYLENLSKDAGQDDNLRLSMATAYWRLGDIQGYGNKPNLGDLKGALASFRKSAELLEPLRAKRAKDPLVVMQVVDTYQHMGSVLGEIGDVPALDRAFQNALPEAKRIATLQPNDVESNEALGVFLNDLALGIQYVDPKRANEYARQHIALMPGLLKKFPGDDDIADEAAVAHATMANLLHRVGDWDHALNEALQSASIREGVSARHPNDVFRRRLLMIAYGHVGDQYTDRHPGEDPERAKGYFEKCVSIARGIVQTDPQDRTARYDLANALMRLGNIRIPGADRTPSLAALRESVAVLESLALESPEATRYRAPLAVAYQYTGLCLRDMGRAEEAIAELRRSVALGDAMLAARPGDINFTARIVRGERLIAEILVTRKDAPAALPHAQRSLSVAQIFAAGPEAGLRKRYLADAHFAVAEVQRALGNWPEADDHARQAISLWNAPEVKDADPKLRQQANAVIAESTVRMAHK